MREALPREIQELADKQFARLKENPTHPSLRFKRIGSVWSVRVGRSYRAIGIEDEDDMVWVWIGSHKEYDLLLKQARKQ